MDEEQDLAEIVGTKQQIIGLILQQNHILNIGKNIGIIRFYLRISSVAVFNRN